MLHRSEHLTEGAVLESPVPMVGQEATGYERIDRMRLSLRSCPRGAGRELVSMRGSQNSDTNSDGVALMLSDGVGERSRKRTSG